jgi:hypothetical protein
MSLASTIDTMSHYKRIPLRIRKLLLLLALQPAVGFSLLSDFFHLLFLYIAFSTIVFSLFEYLLQCPQSISSLVFL